VDSSALQERGIIFLYSNTEILKNSQDAFLLREEG